MAVHLVDHLARSLALYDKIGNAEDKNHDDEHDCHSYGNEFDCTGLIRRARLDHGPNFYLLDDLRLLIGKLISEDLLDDLLDRLNLLGVQPIVVIAVTKLLVRVLADELVVLQSDLRLNILTCSLIWAKTALYFLLSCRDRVPIESQIHFVVILLLYLTSSPSVSVSVSVSILG